MTPREADVIPLHERSEMTTERPPPGDENPPFCPGLENAALAIGEIRDHVQYNTTCLQLIAKHLGVEIPPPPSKLR
jgi:hypothetical protein